MTNPLANLSGKTVVLGLSGGVDSAAAAVLLRETGARVRALHMTNWDDDDGYCTAAADLQDARHVCERLDIPLHHVNFAAQYRDRVFSEFLADYRAGRTPNPDVLCNREIKFGVFREYAKRLGGELIATGHYARTATIDGGAALFKARDTAKDQSYFLHSVPAAALCETVFPLGHLVKEDVRRLARDHGLAVHDKKDSTGICFIGERPFREFLQSYLPAKPGPIMSAGGATLGEHAGLMYYTLGQRHGIGIGGRNDASGRPWYVVDKDLEKNALIVDQGDSPRLYSERLRASEPHWIGAAPRGLCDGLRVAAKIRHRQPDQSCTVQELDDGTLDVSFDQPQRAAAPGQYVVFYDAERCLGGAVIERVKPVEGTSTAIPAAANS